MSQGTAVSLDSPPQAEKREREKSSSPKTKKQPPYAVVVFNDEVHTFLYVVETFQKVFGYPLEKCQTLTMQIHLAGKGVVWSGPLEVAELKRDQIRAVGPDCYAGKKVDFPLGVTIEPLPG
jgi:ATP-dependent Clp protease adaptor protein ClpS